MEKIEKTYAYDEIYMELWELSQRYQLFTSFRVIGSSHDERLIPMLEIGHGSKVLFCIAGMNGVEREPSKILLQMAKDYCAFYEKKWLLNDIYHVQELLNKIRLCVIPIGNPDGYVIAEKGYSCIRNPVYRQLLKMQEISAEEFPNNARNVSLESDFPLETGFNIRNSEQILMENETRMFIRIFTEYESIGLLEIRQTFGNVICYKHGLQMNYMKEAHMARYIKKKTKYHMDVKHVQKTEETLRGNCLQFYTKEFRKPSFRMEIPMYMEIEGCMENTPSSAYEDLRTIPLEFLNIC